MPLKRHFTPFLKCFGRSSKVADALSTLIQHNLVSFERSEHCPTLPEYVLSLDAVIRILRYPRYLLQVKNSLGDGAELLVDELLKSGQETASRLILKAVVRQKGNSKTSEAKIVSNGDSTAADANAYYRHFKDLVTNRCAVEHG